MVFLCGITFGTKHKNKGCTKDLLGFSSLFLMLSLSSLLLLAAFSYQMALPTASVQLGLRGTGRSAQVMAFVSSFLKKAKTKKSMLEALCGHSGGGESSALPYAPLKNQELLPVCSKQIKAQQVWIHSKQRARNLRAARHCAKGNQRKENMLCTTRALLFTE